MFAENLGPLDQTPRSATEINARMQDLAEQTAGPAARIKTEWLDMMIQRIVWLLTRKGILEMPKVDGREIRVVAKSPLARAQKFEEIERIRGFAGDILGIMGPQQGQLFLNQDGVANELQEKWEVPAHLVRNEAEREEMLEGAAQAAQAAQPGGDGQPAPGGLPAQTPIGG